MNRRLLFYRVGDFYEVMGENAKVAAKELDLVLTGRTANNQTGERTPMVGVPAHTLDSYISRLVAILYHFYLFQTQCPIKKYRTHSNKLRNKISHLIEMREDGDIEREYFRSKKTEYELKLTILSKEIYDLSQTPVSEIKQDFIGRIEDLEKQLSSYTPPESLVIPDSVVEAFIEKIWISKDEFRWYLRTNKEEKDEEPEHIKIASFKLTLKDAQDYVYSFSNRRRIFNWYDLNVSVWI